MMLLLKGINGFFQCSESQETEGSIPGPDLVLPDHLRRRRHLRHPLPRGDRLAL